MRFQAIDGIRGILLLLMMWTHMQDLLATGIGYINHHLISFADAAFGFVTLSGIVLGIVLTRNTYVRGATGAFRFTGKRLRIIYIYICLVSIIAWLMWNYAPLVGEEWSPTEETGRPGLLSLLLITGNQPQFWDILPMYLILVALSPFAILMFVYEKVALALAASLSVWLLSQVGLAQHLMYKAHDLFGFPYSQFANPFVVGAWQFVFVLSLYIGFRTASDPGFVPRVKGWIESHVLAVAGLFLVLLLIRLYSNLTSGAPWASTDEATRLFSYENKWLATPIYLLSLTVNGLLIFYLCSVAPAAGHPRLRRVGRGVRAVVEARPLVAMGRKSIQVFATHLIILMIVSLFVPVDSIPAPGRSVLLVGLTASLLLVPPAISGLTRLADREARRPA